MATNYKQGQFQVTNAKKYVGNKVPVYRSGWEYRFMQMADSHPGVIAWSSESYRIPYIHPVTGKQSTYVPDFFIVYVDAAGQKHAEIVEVKPFSQILGNAKSVYDKAHAVINEAKWRYARQWCQQQGLKFRLITENEIFNAPKNSRKRKKARKR